MQISASFLGIKDNIKENINKLTKTNIDYLHLDIMDGKFVTNKTYDIEQIVKIINYDKPLDIHLMVLDVYKYIDAFKVLKPFMITFHYEVKDDIMNIINYLKKLNIKAGLSIKPQTDITLIEPFLPFLDLVLIMGVNPGKGGQKLIDTSISKIKLLKKLRDINNYSYLISVDGGINDETIKLVKDADIAVMGSYITTGDYKQNVDKIKGGIL
ncbi:MAG: ribulose-phosphate 3-epimerase [Bacilli bacterium]